MGRNAGRQEKADLVSPQHFSKRDPFVAMCWRQCAEVRERQR